MKLDAWPRTWISNWIPVTGLRLAHSSSPEASITMGVRPGQFSKVHVQRSSRYAQHLEVCSYDFISVRSSGGNCQRAIQERESGDGAEYSACEPARNCNAKNRADGYHDCLPSTLRWWAGD